MSTKKINQINKKKEIPIENNQVNISPTENTNNKLDSISNSNSNSNSNNKDKEKEKDKDYILSDDEEYLEEYNCYIHKSERGHFYCNTTREFICKECFANEHRKYDSNIPRKIIEKLITSLKKYSETIKLDQPFLEKSLLQISSMNSTIIKLREESNQNLNKFNTKIQKVFKSNNEKIYQNFVDVFNNTDKETDLLYERLNNKSTKESDREIKTIIEELEKLENDNHAKIAYLKENSSIIKNAEKIIENYNNNNNNNNNSNTLKTIKYNDYTNNNKDYFNDYININTKTQENYLNSILSSLTSGAANLTYFLRRFSKFNQSGTIYFENSSLTLKCNHDISLLGLNLSGLKENSFIPISITVSEKLTEEDEVTKQEKDFFANHIEKLSEKTELKLVTNLSDPTYNVYFKESVKLEKNKYYTINIKNLNKDLRFINLFVGSVAQMFIKSNVQTVACNNTNIVFKFICGDKGEESDFNEFNKGIISDLIYTY